MKVICRLNKITAKKHELYRLQTHQCTPRVSGCRPAGPEPERGRGLPSDPSTGSRATNFPKIPFPKALPSFQVRVSHAFNQAAGTSGSLSLEPAWSAEKVL